MLTIVLAVAAGVFTSGAVGADDSAAADAYAAAVTRANAARSELTSTTFDAEQTRVVSEYLAAMDAIVDLKDADLRTMSATLKSYISRVGAMLEQQERLAAATAEAFEAQQKRIDQLTANAE